MKTILVGITTTHNSNWRKKIEDIDKLNIKEVALFPTVLGAGERKEYFEKLSKSKLKSAPHIHIRDDMKIEELKYIHDQYGTKLFNIHATDDGNDFIEKYGEKYKRQLFVENSGELDDNFYQALASSSGLCLDFSHYYDYWYIQKRRDYEKLNSLLPSLNIGCCHISAITKEKMFVDYGGKDKWHYNRHTFSKLSEFDYLKELKEFLPDIISLELENDLDEQLAVKKYIEKNII